MKKRDVPRGHRLREGAVVPPKKRRRRPRKFWFSVSVAVLASGVLVVCIRFGMHDGTLHHLALAVLAERLALGIGSGGEE